MYWPDINKFTLSINLCECYAFPIFDVTMVTVIFENYLRQQARLSDAEITLISSLAVAQKLRRNEALLSAGEVCRCKTFIVSGMLRIYSVAADGSEPILQFSPELNWAIDAESYDKQQPSSYYIAAVEPTEVLFWHKPDFDRLLAEIPSLKKYSEMIISRNIYSGRQRLLAALSSSPEEKYEEFAKNFPGLLSRLPLRMIAAYLGISVKTLTRIRHTQWER